jgi:hypothetical protein
VKKGLFDLLNNAFLVFLSPLRDLPDMGQGISGIGRVIDPVSRR